MLCGATEACNTVTKVCEPAIVLDSVTPRLGYNRGGETAVLAGKLLTPDLTVLFDGVPATVMATTPAGTGEQLSVIVPENRGRKGPSVIELIHPAGQRQRREGLFSYYSPIEFSETQPAGPRDARAIIPGDFNKDGKGDLAVCDNTTSTLQISLGNGDGTLGTAQLITLDVGPTTCASGDLNGDGNLDIVANEQFALRAQVLLGDAQGGFAIQPAFSTVDYFGDIEIADMNGDQRGDLVAADPPGVTVMLGDGQGGFGAAVNYPAHTSMSTPLGFSIGDINGDGKLDAITGNGSDSYFALLLGDGKGVLTTPPTLVAMPKPPRRILTADINRDGRLDLLTSGPGDMQAFISLNKGDGTFEPPIFYKLPVIATALMVRDMNGDMLPDFLWFGVVTQKNFGTYIGLGDGNLVIPQVYTEGLAPSAFAIQDLNGDSKPDVVIAERPTAAPPALGKLRVLLNISE